MNVNVAVKGFVAASLVVGSFSGFVDARRVVAPSKPKPKPVQVVNEPHPGVPRILPQCKHEDSRNCWWDAKRQGNGKGRSFVNIKGQIYYLPLRWS